MHRNKEINSIIFSMNKIALYVIKNCNLYIFYMHYFESNAPAVEINCEKKFLNIKTFCADIDW